MVNTTTINMERGHQFAYEDFFRQYYSYSEIRRLLFNSLHGTFGVPSSIIDRNKQKIKSWRERLQ